MSNTKNSLKENVKHTVAFIKRKYNIIKQNNMSGIGHVHN